LDVDDLIVVGKLGRPRGVHGEIYVTPMTDYPDRFVGMSAIHVRNRKEWQSREIAESRMISGRPVIRFEGIDSPEQAAKLTNHELGIQRDQLVSLPEGQNFLFDLVGCKVVDSETEQEIGEIVEVYQYPANDVYVIKTTDGKSLSLAAVKQFVRHIDVAGKKVVVLAEGLVESN